MCYVPVLPLCQRITYVYVCVYVRVCVYCTGESVVGLPGNVWDWPVYNEVVVEVLQASEQLKDNTLYLKKRRRKWIIMQTTQTDPAIKDRPNQWCHVKRMYSYNRGSRVPHKKAISLIEFTTDLSSSDMSTGNCNHATAVTPPTVWTVLKILQSENVQYFTRRKHK